MFARLLLAEEAPEEAGSGRLGPYAMASAVAPSLREARALHDELFAAPERIIPDFPHAVGDGNRSEGRAALECPIRVTPSGMTTCASPPRYFLRTPPSISNASGMWRLLSDSGRRTWIPKVSEPVRQLNAHCRTAGFHSGAGIHSCRADRAVVPRLTYQKASSSLRQ